jgi:hypothetical protein
MIPSFANLAGTSGLDFHFALTARMTTRGKDLQQLEDRAKLSLTATELRVEPSTSSSKGVWIPYVQNSTVYGYSTAGTKWLGSGPFSGCHLAFFTKGGRLGMAHVAVDGSGDGMQGWESFVSGGGVQVLNKWKIPLASDSHYAATYIFLDLSNPTSIALTQVDVHVPAMGGYQGKIFRVSRVIG